jgi:hypothetical protein
MRHSRIQNTEEDGRVAFDDGHDCGNDLEDLECETRFPRAGTRALR